jgi:hypothetical protein
MLGRLAALLVFALACATSAIAIAGAPAAPTSPEEVKEKLEALREAPIQWELPVEKQRPGTRFDGLDLPLLEILVYTLGGIALIVILFLIASTLIDRRRPVIADRATEENPPPPVRLSGEPLARAEEAAREGRFADAIHLLLLGTIEEIRGSLGYEAHPSLTSREIQRRAPLPAGAAEPLQGLVAEVEWSHFGARGADEEAYRRCVAWHAELRRACAAGAPRTEGARGSR